MFLLRSYDPEGLREDHTITKLPIRIGRAKENDVVLRDRDVSRFHAELSLVGEQLFVRDSESLNGTRLNGELVNEATVHPGDVIQMGDSRVHVLDDRFALDDTEEMKVLRDGPGGMLEVIRAIDLEKVFRNEGLKDDALGFSSAQPDELLERVRRLNTAYSNLMVIMNLVSSVGNYSHPAQVCEQFVTALQKVFPLAEGAAVVEFEHGETAIHVLFQKGFGEDFNSLSHPSRTVLHRVIDEMRAVYAVDARKDPRFRASESMISRGVRSMMCAPLINSGEVQGAIYVENNSKPYCFDQFDLNFLTVFAFHLWAALQTSRALAERDQAYERAHAAVRSAKQDKTALVLQYSQSERKFRALFEQSALGAAVINLMTGHIEDLNEGLVRMLGYNRRLLASMKYEQLLAEGSRNQAEEWLKYVRQNGEGSAKTHLRTKEGEEIVAIQSCRALRVGESAVMVAYFIDITAKERAESQTKRQLLRVTALSELGQALMSTMDSEAIFRLLFENLCTVMPLDEFIVATLDESGTRNLLELVFFAGRKGPEDFRIDTRRRRIPRPSKQIEKAMNEQQSLVQLFGDDSGASDSTGPRGRSVDVPGSVLLSSALIVPFSSRERMTGVVVAQSKEEVAYDSTHLETIRALVAQAALALSNATAFESLKEQQENLRRLSLQIMSAQETERGRISRELHDGVGQQLTGMKYSLEAIRSAAKAEDQEKLMQRIGEARELATQIIDDLRSISLDLRPTMLDDLGLKPTLEWLTRQCQSRYGLNIVLSTEFDESGLSPEISTAAYRIIQEGLGNVAKHAKAKNVTISITLTDDVLRLRVEDDGTGFEANELSRMQTSRGCSGMLNMKERARFLGGNFRLETAPGKGTKIHISIPVKE